MRFLVCVVLLAALLCVLGAPTKAASSYKQGKARSIRGFKNVVLSTARNFGKRAPLEGELVEEATLQANQDFPRPSTNSFPLQWFVDEMLGNPELARSVVRKFIDENQDGELTVEELLRPIY